MLPGDVETTPRIEQWRLLDAERAQGKIPRILEAIKTWRLIEAEQLLESSVALAPRNVTLHYLRAAVHWERGQWQAARDAFALIPDFDPNHALVRNFSVANRNPFDGLLTGDLPLPRAVAAITSALLKEEISADQFPRAPIQCIRLDERDVQSGAAVEAMPTAIAALRLALDGDVAAAAGHFYRWLRDDADGVGFTLEAVAEAGWLINAVTQTTPVTAADKTTGLTSLICRSRENALVDAAATALRASGMDSVLDSGARSRLGAIALSYLGQGSSFAQTKFFSHDDYHALWRGRATCVVIGSTCISHALLYLLRLSKGFRRRFRVKSYITHQHHQYARDFDIPEDLVQNADLLINLAPGWVEWGNEASYRAMLARFPAGSERISFPYPTFQPLWPFHCEDPRRKQCSPMLVQSNEDDVPDFPYGDSFLLSLMRKHDTVDAVTKAYLAADFSQLINLDHLRDKTLRILREKEVDTDIKIADFVAERFAAERLFQSINHVTNRFVLHLCNQILARIGLPDLPAAAETALFELIRAPWSPVHPSVARHFGLGYITPDLRYPLDDRRQVTLNEYVRLYIRHTSYLALH